MEKPEERIAILSDSHSNLRHLTAAARELAQREVEVVIHCGDICSPESVELLAGFRVHWVFGNCDLDREGLRAVMDQVGHRCHGLVGSLVHAGCRIGFTHGHQPTLLEDLVGDGGHHLACHGHTHEARDVTLEGTRVLCPGALSHVQPATFAVLGLASGRLEWVRV